MLVPIVDTFGDNQNDDNDWGTRHNSSPYYDGDDEDDDENPYWQVQARRGFWENLVRLRWCWPSSSSSRKQQRRRAAKRLSNNSILVNGRHEGAEKRESLSSTMGTSSWTVVSHPSTSEISGYNHDFVMDTSTTASTPMTPTPVDAQQWQPKIFERDRDVVVVKNKQQQHYNHPVEREEDPHISVTSRSLLEKKKSIVQAHHHLIEERSRIIPKGRQGVEHRDEQWVERSTPTSRRVRVAGTSKTQVTVSPRPPRPPGTPSFSSAITPGSASVTSTTSPTMPPVRQRLATTASLQSLHRRRQAHDSFCFSTSSLQQILNGHSDATQGEDARQESQRQPPVDMICVGSGFSPKAGGGTPTAATRGRVISMSSRGLTGSSIEDEDDDSGVHLVDDHGRRWIPPSSSPHLHRAPPFGDNKHPSSPPWPSSTSPSNMLRSSVPFRPSPRSVVPSAMVLADDAIPSWMMAWAGQPQRKLQQQQQQQLNKPQEPLARGSSIVTTGTSTGSIASSLLSPSSPPRKRTNRAGCYFPTNPRPPTALSKEDDTNIALQGWAGVALFDHDDSNHNCTNNNRVVQDRKNNERTSKFSLWYVQAQFDGVIHLSRWPSNEQEQNGKELASCCNKRIQLVPRNNSNTHVSLELEPVSDRAGHCLSIYQQQQLLNAEGNTSSRGQTNQPPHQQKVLSILPVRLLPQHLQREQELYTAAVGQQVHNDNTATASSGWDQVLLGASAERGRLYAPAEQHDAVLHWRFSLDLLCRSR